MDFRISGLPAATFKHLFALPDADLAAHGAMRMTADRQPGFPCRVSLRDADPGETVLLVNFEHLPVATPYRSRHAIFVRENATDADLSVNEIPQVLLTRLLSVRALSSQGMLLEADVTEGPTLESTINRMLNVPEVGYLHIHNAKPGCYAARVNRVQV